MSKANDELSRYVRRVMETKGLTQKDVQRGSGGRITDGYVASILTARASNPSVDKIKALADGLGVDVDELFHIAAGLPAQAGSKTGRPEAAASLRVLELLKKLITSPDVLEILNEVVRMNPADRAVLLKFAKSIEGSGRRAKGRSTRGEKAPR
jgi:transcriptional regulator with XRE-family HTH domain